MKLSLIHNQYKRNPYFRESMALCLHALRTENIDYEYIIFNDNGDKEIEEDAKEFFSDKRVKYVYSPVNFGHKTCTGGWLGAVPHLTGDLVHNMGQDDVFTPNFYRIGLETLEKTPDAMAIHFNGFICNENLEVAGIMLPVDRTYDYYGHPFEAWKEWFGVGNEDRVTRANNTFLAPGVIYRRKLHDLIGLPDVDNFLGAVDFEYWSRILFYGHKVVPVTQPTWLYRKSKYSTSSGENQDALMKSWSDRIKVKFEKLYEERKHQ